jgi:endonuclease/exonuclease/phosphatase (EEP) superfamily protein YafD
MKIRWLLLSLLLVALLVPAGALTAARIVQPPGGAWVRLVAFTPFAVPLYVVAALLLLLAWWRSRGGWRSVVRMLTVVALVGVGLHLFWASGPYVGQPTAAAGSDTRLRVMTANLRLGEATPSRVVEVAVRNDVDVLVLEEVTVPALGGMQAAGLAEAFPHRAGEPGGGPSGTMVFSTRPLTDVHPLDTHFGGYVATVRVDRQDVHLVAVHPRTPVGDAVEWRQDQQAVQRAASAQEGPTVLAGDFNATLDHQPMRELLGRGFSDAAAEARAGWQPTWPASHEVSVLGIRVPSLIAIDHVLVSTEIRAKRTETVTIGGTDHRALVATLTL